MLPSKGMEDWLTIWSFLSFRLSLSGQMLREFLLLILNMIFVVSLLVSLDFILILYHTTCVPFLFLFLFSLSFFFLFFFFFHCISSYITQWSFLLTIKIKNNKKKIIKKNKMQREQCHIPMNLYLPIKSQSIGPPK